MHTSPNRNSILKTVGLGAALAFLATEAAAEIHYVDNTDISASTSSSSTAIVVSFNPITGATDARQSFAGFEAIGFGGCSSNNYFYFKPSGSTITSGGFLAQPVAEGTVINASAGSWTDYTSAGFGLTNFTGYAPNASALVAYRFKTTADANTYLYGWFEVSRENTTSYSVALYSYAYEDSGTGIVAGATSSIPEPGMTAAIFGLVAVALIGFRRIRQRAVHA